MNIKTLLKWGKFIALFVLSLFTLLCISLVLIAGTQSGTIWLLDMINSQSAGELRHTSVEGHLLGDLHIRQLSYSDENIQLQLDNLQLSWQVRQLFQGRFYLQQLVINKVTFEQKKKVENKDSDTTNSAENFSLSNIVFPLELIINKIKVSEIELVLSPHEKPLVIKQLTFKGNAIDDSISISELSAQLTEVDFSSRGKLKLSGDYPLEILTDVQVHMPDIPRISLHGQINGDLSKLEFTQTIAGDMQGSINAVIQQPLAEPKWDTAIKIADIPYSLLDKKLFSDDISFDISLLSSGDLKNNLIKIQQFQLSSEQANINIDGSIGQQLDLKWQLAIPQLNNLSEDMSGAISAGGQLSGTQAKPVISGEMTLDQLLYETNQLDHAQLNFSLSTDNSYKNQIALSIDKIISGSNSIADISLTLHGPLTAHSIELQSQVDGHKIFLTLKGGINDIQQQWLGNIEQVNIQSEKLGSWQQLKPSHLSIKQNNATLETLCLIDKKSTICTTAQWQPEQSQAKVQVKHINLKRFEEFFPDEIKQFSGEINLDAQMIIQDVLSAELNLELQPGVFSYQLTAEQIVQLKHKNGYIKAIYAKDKVTAQWNLNLGEHSVQGDISMPRAKLDANPDTTPIQGHIILDVTELSLLSAFSPEVEDISGFIHADLQLSGNISDPVVLGSAEFSAEKINIPLSGLEFSQIKLQFDAKSDKHININGQINSAQEKITLNGELVLDAGENWPLKLHIKGEDFQIINLPEVQAIISPDIKITHGLDGISINGLLIIPEATIHLKELPEGAKNISDDTIIIGAEEKNKAIDVAIDVTLKMGEKVHLKGFGLNTYLNGQMRLRQIPGQLATANGELSTREGTFRAYGQDLIITQGKVFYAGGYLDNPGLNIKAAKEIDDITVGVIVSGTAKDIQFQTYASDPQLSQKDIAALLLTGQTFDNSSDATVYAGTELTDKLSIGVNMGTGDAGSEAVVRYKLHKNIHVEGTSSADKSGGNVIYSIELD